MSSLVRLAFASLFAALVTLAAAGISGCGDASGPLDQGTPSQDAFPFVSG